MQYSVVLPILEDKKLDVILATPPVFSNLLKNGQISTGDIVIEDYRIDSPLLTKIENVSAPNMFSENETRTQAIYRVSVPSGR